MLKNLFRLLALTLLLCGSAKSAYAQAPLLGDVMPNFLTANGAGPESNGFLCTTVTGTPSPLYTYQDSGLTNPNQDPITLNAAGQPVNGTATVSIYMQNATYRITLYAAGTGSLCNGVPVGPLVRQVDGIIGNGGGGGGGSPFSVTPPFIYPTAITNSLVINGTVASFTPPEPSIIIGNGGALIASSTFPNATNQSLVELFNSGTASILDSTASAGGATLPLDLQIAQQTKLRVQTSGDVSIGTTGDDGFTLSLNGTEHVVGNAQFDNTLTLGGVPYTAPAGYPVSSGYILSSTTAGITSWVAAGSGATAGWTYSSPTISLATNTDRVVIGQTVTDIAGSAFLAVVKNGSTSGVYYASAASNASYLEMTGGTGFVGLISSATGGGSTEPIRFQVGLQTPYQMQTSGNNSFGTTTDNGYKVDVEGTFHVGNFQSSFAGNASFAGSINSMRFHCPEA